MRRDKTVKNSRLGLPGASFGPVLCVIVACGVLLIGAAAPAGAQSKAAQPVKKDPSAEFNKLLADWKKLIVELRQKNIEYRNAKPEDRDKVMEDRKAIVERGEALEPKLVNAAEAAYIAAPNNNKEAAELLSQLAADALERERYDEALRLSNTLIKQDFDNKRIYAIAGQAAFDTNDFDAAAKLLKIAKEAEMLSETDEQLLAAAESYQDKWKAEQELRAAEAKANDLPRVKLTTSKGDIVVELFENEAPNTVANFISLVENGKYDGTPFHRVLSGFMAQGGDPIGDGSGGPGYTIPCECYADNHRLHFRGSLSMAHSGRDTGGSQFFLTFVPTPHLDGKHTVFGRIISGNDVLDSLQRRDPSAPNPPAPDTIVSAEVVRKRNHDYVPQKVAGSETAPTPKE